MKIGLILTPSLFYHDKILLFSMEVKIMKSKTSNLLKCIVFLVLGILLCCSVIDPNSLLNWIISVSFLVSGAMFLCMSLVVSRSLLTDTGLTGGLILALGIFFLPSLPGGMSINWMGGISMIMMVVGAILLFDALLGLCYRRKMASNLIVLILGAALFAIGICLWLIADFRAYAGLMLGIFFIIYAVILFISLIQKKDYFVITVKSTKKK